MAGPLLVDRVKETTTTTGTGTVNLAGAVTGFQSFVSGIGNANTCFYCISHQTLDEWEIGIGTVTDASPDTLSRSTILTGTNGTSPVNFSSGTKDVFCVAPGTYGLPYQRDVSTFSVRASNETLGGQTVGNARGNYAVDLQLVRTNANQVASAQYSVLAGGRGNRSAGDTGVVCGGESNAITDGSYQVVCGGVGNLISSSSGGNTVIGGSGNEITAGAYNLIGGGLDNVISSASGLYNVIAGGNENTMTGTGCSSCFIAGSDNNINASNGGFAIGIGHTIEANFAGAIGFGAEVTHTGGFAHSSGIFAATGDCQRINVILRCQTTNATETEMFVDGSSERLVIPDDTTWAFECMIVGRRTDTGSSSYAARRAGVIHRGTGAGSLAAVAAFVVELLGRTNASYGSTTTVDTTNGSLKFTVTGVSGHSMNWMAYVTLNQLVG